MLSSAPSSLCSSPDGVDSSPLLSLNPTLYTAVLQLAAEFNNPGSASDGNGPTGVAASQWASYNSVNGLPTMTFNEMMGDVGNTVLAETYLDVEVLGAVGYGGINSRQGSTISIYNLDQPATDFSDPFTYFAQDMLAIASAHGVGTPNGVPQGACAARRAGRGAAARRAGRGARAALQRHAPARARSRYDQQCVLPPSLPTLSPAL